MKHSVRLSSESMGGVQNKTIVQLCPGAGALSREFLNAGARRILAIEREKRYGVALKDLEEEASNAAFSYRIHEIYYWSLVFEKWPELLHDVPKQPWETTHQDLLLFGILPARNAHYYLPNIFRQVASRTFLFNWGRFPIYLAMPKRVATFLSIGPGDKRRNVISLQAQAYCDIEVLLEIPQAQLVPQPPENIVLMRLMPLSQSRCMGVPHEEYEFVVRQLYVQKKHSLLRAIG